MTKDNINQKYIYISHSNYCVKYLSLVLFTCAVIRGVGSDESDCMIG